MSACTPVSVDSRRKPLDIELNLVPFIDLLSCLISFLLITAVWTQVSAIPATSTSSVTSSESPADLLPARVTITPSGYRVSTGGHFLVEVPRKRTGQSLELDHEGLVEQLRSLGVTPPRSVVTVKAEDSVGYSDLSTTLDALSAAGLHDIGITGD